LPLCLTKHHAVKTCGITSAVDEIEWSVSRPGLFTLCERYPGTLWIGGLVGPRATFTKIISEPLRGPWYLNRKVKPADGRNTEITSLY
jgi:hypothetical protein